MIGTGCTFLQACEQVFEKAGLQENFEERGVRPFGGYRYPKPSYAPDKSHVYAYWAQRSISKKTIDYLDIQEDKEGNTLFQYYDQNDVLVNCKVRPSRPVRKPHPKIWYLPDADHTDVLYNINRVNPTSPLVICCGEGDCAALIESGVYNAVSIGGGDGNTNWIGECWTFLEECSEIILIPDNDKSGEKWAREVSVRLGEYRVKLVDLPRVCQGPDGEPHRVKDVNDLLYLAGPEAVREAVRAARESEIPSIVDYTDVKKFDMSDVDGFTTGFLELDRALQKFYMGTTTVLTGSAGSGKSSLLSTLICQSVEQGFPCFVYSGELSNPSLKNWVDSVHAGQRGMNEYKSRYSTYYKIKNETYEAINRYYKDQIFFYRDGFEHKASKLLSTMESVVRKYGVKTIILDNMTSLDLENNDNNKYIKQDEFIREIIEFSKKWQVCCLLVLHPKKMEAVRRMSIFDLQGVVSAVNLAHRVLALYRVPPKEKEGVVRNGKILIPPIRYDVLIDVLKDRFGSGANKTAGLWYDVPSKRFFDSLETLDHQYGWDMTDYASAPLPFPPPQLEEEAEVFGRIEVM